jgi:glycosyltransferase involved in cell wall biosynthesis
MGRTAAPLRVFTFYTDTPQRRAALRREPGAAERYCLFGLDELRARGVQVEHNLEHAPSAFARTAGHLVNRALYRRGGWGGELATVLACRVRAGAADVVLSTVDRVGIPLALAADARIVRTPVVYVSVGLLERLERLRGRMPWRYARAFSRLAVLATYSRPEADRLADWFREHGREREVRFLPFGVDTDAFRPEGRSPSADVVSVGADPQRDFALLATVAARHPELTFVVVASRHNAPGDGVPANVQVQTEVGFERARELLASARVVALPVRENSYSGATTTLLQAMALGQPVVVSRTEAIASGYELADGHNCRLVPPGDAAGFEAAVLELLRDEAGRAALGRRARETVERSFTWDRYVESLHELLLEAARRHAAP